jgi:hypothetical protein
LSGFARFHRCLGSVPLRVLPNFDRIANPLDHIIVRLLDPPVDAECSGDGEHDGRNEIEN